MLSEPTVGWLTQSGADVPLNNDWLSSAEQARLNKFRFQKRRADWRLGRWTAKRALASYLDYAHEKLQQLAQIEVRAAADGAPEVFVEKEPARVAISISHSDKHGFSVVDPQCFGVGCDLERIESRNRAFVADYFTEAEGNCMAASPPDTRALLATLIWSAKESALKALRQGLRLDTRSVEVTLEQAMVGDLWNHLTVHFDRTGHIFKGWWACFEDYVQTIVTDPSVVKISILPLE